jgi:hypothetical protein
MQMRYLEVKLAFLHQSVSIPSALNTEKTLNKTKFPGLEMRHIPEINSLLILVKGQVAGCPSANEAIMVYDL